MFGFFNSLYSVAVINIVNIFVFLRKSLMSHTESNIFIKNNLFEKLTYSLKAEYKKKHIFFILQLLLIFTISTTIPYLFKGTCLAN